MKLAQKILVPTDFSTASHLALDAAALLAKQNQAVVVVLYVYDPSLLSPLYAIPGVVALQAPTDVDAFEKPMRVELERLAKQHFEGVHPVEIASMQHGNAADAICAYARTSGADMIVLSTHGRTGLSHMLIGSVAERVVRHATCPVLTLRSKAS